MFWAPGRAARSYLEGGRDASLVRNEFNGAREARATKVSENERSCLLTTRRDVDADRALVCAQQSQVGPTTRVYLFEGLC